MSFDSPIIMYLYQLYTCVLRLTTSQFLDLVVELARDGFTVSEDDCNIEICLIKNMDTAETLTIDVFISEVPPGGNRATG